METERRHPIPSAPRRPAITVLPCCPQLTTSPSNNRRRPGVGAEGVKDRRLHAPVGELGRETQPPVVDGARVDQLDRTPDTWAGRRRLRLEVVPPDPGATRSVRDGVDERAGEQRRLGLRLRCARRCRFRRRFMRVEPRADRHAEDDDGDDDGEERLGARGRGLGGFLVSGRGRGARRAGRGRGRSHACGARRFAAPLLGVAPCLGSRPFRRLLAELVQGREAIRTRRSIRVALPVASEARAACGHGVASGGA